MMADKQPPIIVVPDKSYIDDKGNLILVDAILFPNLKFYNQLKRILDTLEKSQKDDTEEMVYND